METEFPVELGTKMIFSKNDKTLEDPDCISRYTQTMEPQLEGTELKDKELDVAETRLAQSQFEVNLPFIDSGLFPNIIFEEVVYPSEAFPRLFSIQRIIHEDVDKEYLKKFDSCTSPPRILIIRDQQSKIEYEGFGCKPESLHKSPPNINASSIDALPSRISELMTRDIPYAVVCCLDMEFLELKHQFSLVTKEMVEHVDGQFQQPQSSSSTKQNTSNELKSANTLLELVESYEPKYAFTIQNKESCEKLEEHIKIEIAAVLIGSKFQKESTSFEKRVFHLGHGRCLPDVLSRGFEEKVFIISEKILQKIECAVERSIQEAESNVIDSERVLIEPLFREHSNDSEYSEKAWPHTLPEVADDNLEEVIIIELDVKTRTVEQIKRLTKAQLCLLRATKQEVREKMGKLRSDLEVIKNELQDIIPLDLQFCCRRSSKIDGIAVIRNCLKIMVAAETLSDKKTKGKLLEMVKRHNGGFTINHDSFELSSDKMVPMARPALEFKRIRCMERWRVSEE